MKRKHIFISAAVSSVLLGGFLWARHDANRQVYHLKNGLTVEVLPVEPNDLADVFHMSRWKFHITLPPNTNALRTSVQTWRDGKPFPPRQGWVEHPMDSNEFDATVIVRTEHGDFQNDPTIKTWFRYGSLTSGFETKNPFRTQASEVFPSISASVSPIDVEDDGLILMQAMPHTPRLDGGPGTQSFDPRNTVALVLKWTPEDMPAARSNPFRQKQKGFWQSLFASRTN